MDKDIYIETTRRAMQQVPKTRRDLGRGYSTRDGKQDLLM
jgi:hypothetical protein